MAENLSCPEFALPPELFVLWLIVGFFAGWGIVSCIREIKGAITDA